MVGERTPDGLSEQVGMNQSGGASGMGWGQMVGGLSQQVGPSGVGLGWVLGGSVSGEGAGVGVWWWGRGRVGGLRSYKRLCRGFERSCSGVFGEEGVRACSLQDLLPHSGCSGCRMLVLASIFIQGMGGREGQCSSEADLCTTLQGPLLPLSP